MNIIITGASKGIGSEVVKTLSKHKINHIVAISRNGKALDDLAAECKRLNSDAHVTPYEFDLTQFDFYPVIIPRLGKIISRCDILINNAGKLINKPFDKLSQDEFDETFNVNIKCPFLFIQALLPMMNKGGHIVNIASMGGVQGSKKFIGLSAYSASKGAVAILTEALAEELASREIRVNCLALGAVQTEMFATAFPGTKAQLNPAQMAQFVADFAVYGSRYFNGKILPVSLSVP
ncbi:MAG: SDR family oxidoreductase [Bacteroidales bacterium]|jgi:NAD(P)-dependent dehydrogenase (short-subunit alcohol dehydrogenase family)|nr:SDR family oxidoreductase [Bacteroidales bacterium]